MSLPVVTNPSATFPDIVESGQQRETITRRWIPGGRVGFTGVLNVTDRLSLSASCLY
jgi:hypothetical protein